MPHVLIDASALLAVLLDEPERDAIIAATQDCALVAPQTLPFEVGNALVAMHRKQRLTAEQVAETWDAYVSIPVRLVDVGIAGALATAVRCGHYAYDAYMLEAARGQRAPLLTLDKALGRTARAEGLTLLELA